MLSTHTHAAPAGRGFSRRRFLRDLSAASALGVTAGSLGFADALAADAPGLRKRGKAMILLFMAGAPSQFETFDPKPDHEYGGGTDTVQTAIPGVSIAAPWSHVAEAAGEIAFVRSMSNREGNHQRASYQMHTGYAPTGSVRHPALSASVVQQIAPDELALPASVTIGGGRGGGDRYGGGFLGVRYDPLAVQTPGTPPADVAPAVPVSRAKRRLALMDRLGQDFAGRGGRAAVENHAAIYEQAGALMTAPDLAAFTLDDEPQSLKDRYGDTDFGRGCLLARRLVEAGVTFVEVRLGGWDTHADNFTKVPELAAQADPAFATLIADLKDRGMLDDTLVLWTGEFGRTPKINARGGRDHYPRAFNCALAGGGVRGGQVIGSTTPDGTAVADRPVGVDDLLRSCCHALGVDADHEHLSPLGRPLRVVDKGEVVGELFA